MSETATLGSKQRQSRATQVRLLDAAFAEFQQHGLAGGRVDRIAERAGSNKRLIYIYFGDKGRLFDAVVARDVEAMLDSVPFAIDDLPGYAVELFDYLEARPAVLRLFTWRSLERTDTSEAERASYRAKVSLIADAQLASRVDGAMPAVHLLALILGLVGGWAIASEGLHAAAGPDGDRALRRASVHEAVRRLAMPAG